jgi:F-type H+-transporting ATPase subunit delta
MNESKISVRYAKALFALARESGSLDALRKDMELMVQCIREIPELMFVIQSPVIKSVEKIRLFGAMFGGSFQPMTISFINLVLEKHREEYLEGISRYFLRLIKDEQGIQPADVVTAIALDDSLRKSILNLIAQKFNKNTVELHESVDQDLIGGFVLRIGDKQIDASIARKLKNIQQELRNTQI